MPFVALLWSFFHFCSVLLEMRKYCMCFLICFWAFKLRFSGPIITVWSHSQVTGYICYGRPAAGLTIWFLRVFELTWDVSGPSSSQAQSNYPKNVFSLIQLKAQKWWSKKPIKHPLGTVTSTLELEHFVAMTRYPLPSECPQNFFVPNALREPSPPPSSLWPLCISLPKDELRWLYIFLHGSLQWRTLSIPCGRKWQFLQRLCHVILFFLLGASWKQLWVSVLLRLKWWWWFLFPEVRAICNSIILWGCSGYFTALIWWDLYLCWGGCQASKEHSACATLPYALQYFHILSPSFPSSSFYLIIVFISKCLIVFLVTDFLQIAIW